MPSFYSVVQYVPDLVTDERVNVGAIAFDGAANIEVRFLENWKRVRSFAGTDIGFLEELAEDIQRATSDQLGLETSDTGIPRLNEDLIRRMADRWVNTIQLTEPRGSLLSVADLAEDVAHRFLREPKRRPKRFRNRRVAVTLTLESVEVALQSHLGRKVRKLVKRNEPIPGAFDNYRFDVAVKNGRIYYAADALSLEIPDAHKLKNEIDLTAWAIDEVRRRDKALPLAVVAIGPNAHQSGYEKLERVCKGLHAEMLSEELLPRWAEEMARRVPADVLV